MDHRKCSVSTGIHERLDADGTPDKPWGLTYGQGDLDELGYWEIPCQECARKGEKNDGMPVNTYWPFTD